MLAFGIALLFLLLLALLLFSPVVISFSVDTVRGEKRVCVRYLGAIWWDSQKPRKRKKKKVPPKKAKKKANHPKGTRDAKSYLALVRRTAPNIPPAMKKLWKAIRLDNLVVGIRVCRLDAAACALDYGKVCAFLYPALRFCQDTMRVCVKTVQVRCLFAAKDATDAIVSGKIKCTLAAALAAAVSFLIGVAKSTPKELSAGTERKSERKTIFPKTEKERATS